MIPVYPAVSVCQLLHVGAGSVSQPGGWRTTPSCLLPIPPRFASFRAGKALGIHCRGVDSTSKLLKLRGLKEYVSAMFHLIANCAIVLHASGVCLEPLVDNHICGICLREVAIA